LHLAELIQLLDIMLSVRIYQHYTTTNLFSAIKEREQLYIIRQQRKATREAIRLNELVAYAITKSYKAIMNTYIHITGKRKKIIKK